MSKESVFCLASSRDLADQIVARVRTSGYCSNDISALFPVRNTTPDSAQEKNARIRPREKAPAAQRAAWRAARRSGFSSIGALTIPGVGAFVAAGPIIFALSDGLADALSGMGVSDFAARRYAGKIKEGNILILVQADNPSAITPAETIFREAGAHCICTTHEASVKDNSAAESVSGPPKPPESIQARNHQAVFRSQTRRALIQPGTI